MSTSNINIQVSNAPRMRLASPADAPAITTIINDAFRRAESFFVAGDRIGVEEVLKLVQTGQFLLAETAGVVVGCVYVEPRSNSEADFPHRAYLGLLAVDPAHQQSGLGSILMDAGEDYCRALGCQFMDIRVVNLRTELPDYYHRRGYVETGASPFPMDIETKAPCHFIEMTKEL